MYPIVDTSSKSRRGDRYSMALGVNLIHYTNYIRGLHFSEIERPKSEVTRPLPRFITTSEIP